MVYFDMSACGGLGRERVEKYRKSKCGSLAEIDMTCSYPAYRCADCGAILGSISHHEQCKEDDYNPYNPDDIVINYLKPSKELMKKLKLPRYKIKSLVFLYEEMTRVLNRPELYEDPVQHVEALEYSMQIMWGFPPYKDYHSYWDKIKGCTCPQMDNRDMIGTGKRYVNGGCPFHGDNKIEERR